MPEIPYAINVALLCIGGPAFLYGLFLVYVSVDL